ncbi:Retinoblastoma-like protein 1 [Oryzias melastigma]|uniref:Retinoblastoma-like protein 1 n=2 Tax=Oryzias melastigma TaxID=30732 RepID=A0A834FDV8_ORYME|nr:retinoblastoma-like protein 2 isoform X2 [Oryzias melastigma]XP_024152028.1 retinoblastoma-like protein 2 isoform X2 [Oryzias melastigma]KAF6731071.1 Retinoblastoma-like protein 1 [Oryzias melastigma]
MATMPQGGDEEQRKPGPSERLRDWSKDLTEEVKARLDGTLKEFLQNYKHREEDESNKDLAEKCCHHARICCYGVLKKMSEMKRLNDNSGLLSDDFLHRSLVACYLEVHITSNNLPCDFTRLLHILRLTPYHLIKVIGLVMKLDQHYNVSKHLSQATRQILERLAWTSDSPLWEKIQANGGRFPLIQQVMSQSFLESSQSVDSDCHQPQDHVSFEMYFSSNDNGEHPPAVNKLERNNSLHQFSRMVYALAAARLEDLCCSLKLSEDQRGTIWTCFENSLVQYPRLMENHHLDQLLFSSIFITAQVTQIKLSVSDIMEAYSSLPYSTESICKEMLITDSVLENQLTGDLLTPSSPREEERGSFVSFYRAYSSKMQNFAKQFNLACGGDTPPSSPYPKRQKDFSLRYRVPNTNLFISRLNKDSPSLPTPTHTFMFGSSPAESICKINKVGAKVPVKGRALSFKEEDEEDEPPAKRRQTDAQSVLHHRLTEVIEDRSKVLNHVRV